MMMRILELLSRHSLWPQPALWRGPESGLTRPAVRQRGRRRSHLPVVAPHSSALVTVVTAAAASRR